MIIVLSGEIAAGKTTLAKALAARGPVILKTRDLLEASWFDPGSPTREQLQALGEKLDRETNGRWVAIETMKVAGDVVIDSARRPEHVGALREAFPHVYHIHLEAASEVLSARYHRRGEADYSRVKADPTEAQVGSLRAIADLVVDTSRNTPEDVFLRVLALVDPAWGTLKNPPFEPIVDVIVGGQYGSEGKGHVVAHIAPDYDCLIRVGGPNAGHTVLHPETNEKVSFYHLPSGALHSPQADLVLGPGAVINPDVLMKELRHLDGPAQGRLFIDPQANVIGPEDIALEETLVKGIGSTGQGVGAATAAKIYERGSGRQLAGDHPALKPFIKPTLQVLEDAYRFRARVLLEGTQGTGLSLHHGHYPYVTSRDTTASGTAGEAGIPPRRIRKVIVVMRTNPIRVASPEGGTSGPMGREISWEEIAARSGVAADMLREREKTTTTKRLRRIAEFSWIDLQRAVMLNGPTDIALTFVDYISPKNTEARRYEQLTEETLRFIEEIERVARCPVSLITTRVHRRSIIDRRSW